MDSIKCPNCGSVINIGDELKKELQGEFSKKYEELKQKEKLAFDELELQKSKLKDEFEKQKIIQQRAIDELNRQKSEFDEKLKAETAKALNAQKLTLQNEIKAKLEDENSLKFEAMKNELAEKSKKISEFNKLSAEFEILKSQNENLKSEYEAKAQKEISIRLKEARDAISKEINEQNELKIKQANDEKEKLLKEINELKRRAEVGSQQLQGEVMEVAIEEYLRASFPFDEIEEIKKGVNGADCLQIINTKDKRSCGKILYESKRTKAFGGDWIEKFKNDMREAGADAGILVTQTMPKELERMGLLNGVWVCDFSEFKGLCAVIRQGVIDISYANLANQNKDSKMQMLYSYLVSNEFKMQVEGVVSAFVSMQQSLIKEQNAMRKIWKDREVLINKARDNAIAMHSSIRGIAGNAIADIQTLELGYDGE
ncbi:MAG: DUF2130 domain-containing protein [Campylobacter sp.]|nr:DUF2130 domain-containing protein [Campylobacter sp.]